VTTLLQINGESVFKVE